MTGEFDALYNMDCETEVRNTSDFIRNSLVSPLKRRGVVIGLSGGIDSSTCTALCSHALGPEKVFAILMPERDSSEETLEISRSVAEEFNVEYIHEDISGILDSLGCYNRQSAAVQKAIPDFTEDWKFKIVLPPVDKGLRVFSVVAQSPDGATIKKRLPHDAYLEIVAATNFKQRVRKMLEYYYADRLNYAVIGTPNLQEYDQGFFVKNGDGSADIKPIAHLYKTQVFSIARHLGVPESVLNRPPTTDTYSLSQGQDEFYFSLPLREMDICLYGLNNNLPDDAVCSEAGIAQPKLEAVYRDIKQKRETSVYLHKSPLTLVE